MIKKKIKVDTSNERLDVFLTKELSQSRNFVQKLCDEGLVTVNGSSVKKNYVLSGDESLEVTLPDAVPTEIKAESLPIDIIYEDDHLLVVNKPRGMVVHPAAGHYEGTLVNALLAHCGAGLSGIGGELRPGIVHRIDKDTSGLLIAAKDDKAHIALSSQLSDRSLSRVYDAVVYGKTDDQGTVDAPIGRSPKDRKKMAVVPGGKRAVTHYTTLCVGIGFSHVKCKLETGRTHQIRVHMACIGHPVAGDPLYGPKKDRTGLGGQCLHASEIRFIHPVTKERMEFSCPLPEYFVDFLGKCGLD